MASDSPAGGGGERRCYWRARGRSGGGRLSVAGTAAVGAGRGSGREEPAGWCPDSDTRSRCETGSPCCPSFPLEEAREGIDQGW